MLPLTGLSLRHGGVNDTVFSLYSVACQVMHPPAIDKASSSHSLLPCISTPYSVLKWSFRRDLVVSPIYHMTSTCSDLAYLCPPASLHSGALCIKVPV
ncbi:hypothetical protein IF1G_04748 [Cordyceps javanica]|uniref:Uncharacterized protein n=1 Tax=Cordyceps javanica TaxID=43265 RepID=A0A545V377_9HYPO|nr:hypothetical protein IF1G_04748 [Cordyceps javanica]